MDLIAPLLLIVGGILAISNLIVAKKPDAKVMLDKLVPFQAGIGIALLAFGLYNLITGFTGTPSVFQLISFAPVIGLTALALIVASILLGFLFGMPQIAKWMPGEGNAEQKGIELSKKLAPFQVILGLVGIGVALLWLLFRFRILGLM
jgi:hypothetical protein